MVESISFRSGEDFSVADRVIDMEALAIKLGCYNNGAIDYAALQSKVNSGLEINIEGGESVVFDFDDIGANGKPVIDFDLLTIKDADGLDGIQSGDDTDFQIFVADTDGLIIDTMILGTADAHGVSNIGSVSVSDAMSEGLTFASNALSVALDDTGWESEHANGEYLLNYDIDNSVLLNNNVTEGFKNTIDITGTSNFEQNDVNGLNNGVINIKFDIDSTVDADLVYNVNITDAVSKDTAENLAGGVEVHVFQSDTIKSTSGELSVDTNTTIGVESSRSLAYGYQLQNWLASEGDNAKLDWAGTTYDATWIAGMAAAMIDADNGDGTYNQNAMYQGEAVNDFVTALKNATVEIKGDSETRVINRASTTNSWVVGSAAGRWHNFHITTNRASSSEQNSNGYFYVPQEVYNRITSAHPGVNTSGTYKTYGGGADDISSLTVDVTGLGVVDANGNAVTVARVVDLLAGGGLTVNVTGADTATGVEYTKINSGTNDDFQLLFGTERFAQTALVSTTVATHSSFYDAKCRNCDPVAMIFFEEASGDLSALKASTNNEMELLGEDYSNRTLVHQEDLAQNVEMQTGVFMGSATENGTYNASGVAGVIDGPTAYINQDIHRAGSAQNYQITGQVGDQAAYVEGYTSVTGADSQNTSRVTALTGRINDALRNYLSLNLSIDIDNPNTYNDNFAQFFIDNPGEMNSVIADNMIDGYLSGNISVEKFAPLLSQIAVDKEGMFQVFMRLGISADSGVDSRLVSLFNNMNADSLSLAIDTLIEYVGSDSIASLYYQVSDPAEFNDALQVYFQQGKPRSQDLADSLVKLLVSNPSEAKTSRFTDMVFQMYPDINAMSFIAKGFENNWGADTQRVFADIATFMIHQTTIPASDFKEINTLIELIDNVSAESLFTSLQEKALAGDGLVQAYLREAVVAASRGNINDLDNALGQIQAQAVIAAASVNLDKGESLAAFGVTDNSDFLLNVDSIVVAAEYLYQAALEDQKPELADTLVSKALSGVIGFDLNATDGPAYYNNIKRVVFISQGEEGSLLSAIGHSSSMSNYLADNQGLMSNKVADALNNLVGITGFIGSNGSGYFVQHVDMSMEDFGIINRSYGSNYADENANSYRAFSLLSSSDRSTLNLILDYEQDVSDWSFSSTHSYNGDDGKPKLPGEEDEEVQPAAGAST